MKTRYFVILLMVVVLSACFSLNLRVEKWPPNDISECEDFQDEGDRHFDHTKRDCYLYFFRENTNLSDCSLVSDRELILECQFSVAVNSNSIDLCNQIDDASYSEICLQRVYDSLIPIARENNDPSICEQMDGFRSNDGHIYYLQRNECFYEIAITHKRPELCSYFMGETYGSVNEENCLMNSK